MKREEIKKEMAMTYEELQHYLIQKYGGAIGDYFATPECKSKNRKIVRVKEGLYCHHMDEDKGGNLSNPPQATRQPFAWQKKDRLVYCNILEHLILHMKIAILRQRKMLEIPDDIIRFFTTGGIYMICDEINDMFMNDGTTLPWKKRCFEEIRENYEDYIILIKSFVKYIETSYSGDKTKKECLVLGSIVDFWGKNCVITRISKKKDDIFVRFPSGEEKRISLIYLRDQITYTDRLDSAIRKMSSGFKKFYENIYKDIIAANNEKMIMEYQEKLKIDYHGYGFVQYADIKLDKDFGAINADEYISKALPMYSKDIINLKGKIPKFWKGKSIPSNIEDAFYIIRMTTSFTIKPGMEPCVKYRERDSLRGNFRFTLDDNHNLRDVDWIILETSDIYSREHNAYCSKYIDFDGNIVEARVTMSLGKNDYLLFKERYNIRYLEILNGCYFIDHI